MKCSRKQEISNAGIGKQLNDTASSAIPGSTTELPEAEQQVTQFSRKKSGKPKAGESQETREEYKDSTVVRFLCWFCQCAVGKK